MMIVISKYEEAVRGRQPRHKIIVFDVLPGPPLKIGEQVLPSNSRDSKGIPRGGAEDLQLT